MKKIFLVILILLVLTAITKPSENSFKQYINTELKSNVKDDFLTKFVKNISKIQSDLTINYYDKVFFSIAETTIGNDQHKFLGVCGMWFEINK